MKIGNRFSLIAAAAGLFFSAYSGGASADMGWVQTRLQGHAAVSAGTIVYSLSNTWDGVYGWTVESSDYTTTNNPIVPINAGGTSIAVDSGGGIWVAHADGNIQKVNSSDNFSGSLACEYLAQNGTTMIRHDLGHNNLALTDALHPYIIDWSGAVRGWDANSTCWQLLPALPSGVIANDIASSAAGLLRAVDGNGILYEYLPGTTVGNGRWIDKRGNGEVLAIMSVRGLPPWGGVDPRGDYGLGIDQQSIWIWDPTSAGIWFQAAGTPSVWGHWKIFQLGSSVRNQSSNTDQINGVATGLNGIIWAYGDFHDPSL